MMEYKGYIGEVEVDTDRGVLYGSVNNTRDVITFEGETVKEVRQAFQDSVDDYLEFCKERGESPDKPFSGKFQVRLAPDLHRQIAAAAHLSKMSLNGWVAESLKLAVGQTRLTSTARRESARKVDEEQFA